MSWVVNQSVEVTPDSSPEGGSDSLGVESLLLRLKTLIVFQVPHTYPSQGPNVGATGSESISGSALILISLSVSSSQRSQSKKLIKMFQRNTKNDPYYDDRLDSLSGILSSPSGYTAHSRAFH